MKERRSFIKKIAAVTSAAAIGNLKVFSSTNNSDMENLVRNIKPLGFQWETRDPFLFCVHHEDYYPKGNKNMGPDPELLKGRDIGQDFMIKDGWRMYHGSEVPGFPSHPHRGFETVTVVRKGFVDHSDSLGAAGRYGNGDVQWMTAGKGIQHAEMFPLIHEDEVNTLELFQIWLNLPKANKFVKPHFKMLWAASIPFFESIDENGKKTQVEVIAGEIGEKKAPSPPPDSWAATIAHEVAIWNIKMEAGAIWNLPPASHGIHRTVYFYKGDQLIIDNSIIDDYHSAEITADVELELKSGEEDSHILILQGKPIGEAVVQHGPFVMNTRLEIQQAFEDYQRTAFGGWPWPENDPVHPRDQGRFAKHSDGSLESKD